MEKIGKQFKAIQAGTNHAKKVISKIPDDAPFACIDPETCPDPFIHPGYLGLIHKKFVSASNERLKPKAIVFDASDPDYSHFYGTIMRYFTRQPDFFKSEYILNDKTPGVGAPSFNKGLLVLGDHGVGKTFMFNVLNQLNPFIRKFNNSFSFMSALEVVELYNLDGSKGIQQLFRGQRYFDDVGTEDAGQHFGRIEVFKVLLERRYDLYNQTGQKTFITSNLSRDQFAKIYGSRIESRLYEMFNIMYAGGIDRRKTGISK